MVAVDVAVGGTGVLVGASVGVLVRVLVGGMGVLVRLWHGFLFG